MNNFIKGVTSIICAGILLLSDLGIGNVYAGLVPQNDVSGNDDSANYFSINDFSANFTGVDLLDGSGNTLSGTVAKDASMGVKLIYTVPDSGLSVGTRYTFTLPEAITSKYTGDPINILDESNKTMAIVEIFSNAPCTITFKEQSAAMGGEEGEFRFFSKFDADKIPNGTSTIKFDLGKSSSFEKTVDFLLDQMQGSVQVSNTPTLDTSQSKVTWKVKVTPDLKNAGDPVGGKNPKELTAFKITNAIDSRLTLCFDKADASTYPVLKKNGMAVVDAHFSLEGKGADGAGGTLVCNLADGEWNASDYYEIDYVTHYSLGAFEDKDGEIKLKDTATAEFNYYQYAAGSSSKNQVLSSTKMKATAKEEKEVAVSQSILSKTSEYQGSNHTITWKLTINESNIQFDSAFNITDKMPVGLKLVSVKKDNALLTAGTDYTYTYTGTDDYSGGNLTVNNLPRGSKSIIEYTTEIDPLIWKKEPGKKFPNQVQMKAVYGGKNYTFNRKIEPEFIFGGTNGGMIGAAGKYDPTNHTFTWDIQVNSDKMALQNGIVTITIPDGLTYESMVMAPGTLNAVQDPVDRQKWTVTLPGTVTNLETITLKTTVNDPNLWATNSAPTKFQLKTKLTSVTDDIDLNANPIAETQSKVIEKSSDGNNGYNYNTKEITWKVTFNQNKMAMTDPILVDELPPGTEYVDGSIVLNGADFKDNSTTSVVYDASKRKLTISLKSMTLPVATEPYFTYKMKITDESLLKWGASNETSQEIKNRVSISFGQAPGALIDPKSLTSEYSRTVGSRPLHKIGSGNADYRNFQWTIEINPNQITLTTPEIVDNLPDKLIADLESVKLYEATVNDTTGVLSQGALVYDGERPENYSDYRVTLVGQRFTFSFNKNTNKAYLLKFETDNLDPAAATYNNSVFFSSDAGSSAGMSGEVKQAAANGGSTNPKRGTIKLTSKTEGGAILPGVKYRITGKTTGITYDLITDSFGVALFTPLKFDTYTITENLDGIPGYAPLQNLPVVTINATNKNAAPEMKYADGTGTATLVTLGYDKNAPSATGTTPPIQRFGTGVNAVIIGNPFTNPNYDFVEWNTKADGSGTGYQVGDTLTMNTNTVLYAVWKKKSNQTTIPPQQPETENNQSGADHSPGRQPVTMVPENKQAEILKSPKTGDEFPLTGVTIITIAGFLIMCVSACSILKDRKRGKRR